MHICVVMVFAKQKFKGHFYGREFVRQIIIVRGFLWLVRVLMRVFVW